MHSIGFATGGTRSGVGCVYAAAGQPGIPIPMPRAASRDFASWSPFVPILPIDVHDRFHDQVYMNNGFVYDDMYVGFAQILHALDDWSLDVDLAYSRDGEDWIRPPEARAILPRGEGVTWDSGRMAMLPSAPVRLGDQLLEANLEVFHPINTLAWQIKLGSYYWS